MKSAVDHLRLVQSKKIIHINFQFFFFFFVSKNVYIYTRARRIYSIFQKYPKSTSNFRYRLLSEINQVYTKAKGHFNELYHSLAHPITYPLTHPTHTLSPSKYSNFQSCEIDRAPRLIAFLQVLNMQTQILLTVFILTRVSPTDRSIWRLSPGLLLGNLKPLVCDSLWRSDLQDAEERDHVYIPSVRTYNGDTEDLLLYKGTA